MEKHLIAECIKKGSITVDGTSLTIFEVTDTFITISLIPHTYEQTVLGYKKPGDVVNIETDLIGKYVKNIYKIKREVRLQWTFCNVPDFKGVVINEYD